MKVETKAEQPQLNEAEVRKQIEFYFGDANLRRDKFLNGEIAKNEEGWVQLQVICSFGKMKSMNATDVAAVAACLANSESLILNDDKTSIRRKTPLPEVDDSSDRTIHAKRFPAEMTLEQLHEFWAQYGTVLMVTMRRLPNKNFKGSVLVEFSAADAVKNLLAIKDTVKHGDTPLEIRPIDEWKGAKDAQKEKNQQKKNESESRKRKAGEEERSTFVESLSTRTIPENQVLRVTGMPEGVTIDEIKDHFNPFQAVAFVQEDGEGACYIRFDEPCTEVAEKAKDAKFKDNTLTITMLTADEAKTYWTEMWTQNFDRRSEQNKRGGGRGRGGRGRGRGGRGGRSRPRGKR